MRTGILGLSEAAGQTVQGDAVHVHHLLLGVAGDQVVQGEAGDPWVPDGAAGQEVLGEVGGQLFGELCGWIVLVVSVVLLEMLEYLRLG